MILPFKDIRKRLTAHNVPATQSKAEETPGDANAAVNNPTISSQPDQATIDELANVRAVAKEWLGATTALFGLFSLSGVVFGGDALTGLGGVFFALTVGCAVLAVVVGAASIFFGNRAAHGWPTRKDLRERQDPDPVWEAVNKKESYKRARKDHWKAVWCAGASLAFLTSAIVALWFSQSSWFKETPASATVVRVLNEQNRTVACGPLQELTETEAVIRVEDGRDESVQLLDGYTVITDDCA